MLGAAGHRIPVHHLVALWVVLERLWPLVVVREPWARLWRRLLAVRAQHAQHICALHGDCERACTATACCDRRCAPCTLRRATSVSTVKKLKRINSDQDASQQVNVEQRQKDVQRRKTVECKKRGWSSLRASCTARRQTWPAPTRPSKTTSFSVFATWTPLRGRPSWRNSTMPSRKSWSSSTRRSMRLASSRAGPRFHTLSSEPRRSSATQRAP